MKENIKSAIRALLCRLLWRTEPPYQCYWRDRALKAEKELGGVRAQVKRLADLLG